MKEKLDRYREKDPKLGLLLAFFSLLCLLIMLILPIIVEKYSLDPAWIMLEPILLLGAVSFMVESEKSFLGLYTLYEEE